MGVPRSASKHRQRRGATSRHRLRTIMITLDDYFGQWIDHPDATSEVKQAAEVFLARVNALLDEAFEAEVDLPINPKTNSHISGVKYGGFRPQDCPQGSPKSSHKVGRGVDVYDPDDSLDFWCMRNTKLMESLGLYMEHPSATRRWCHLTDRAPLSGKRVFHP